MSAEIQDFRESVMKMTKAEFGERESCEAKLTWADDTEYDTVNCKVKL